MIFLSEWPRRALVVGWLMGVMAGCSGLRVNDAPRPGAALPDTLSSSLEANMREGAWAAAADLCKEHQPAYPDSVRLTLNCALVHYRLGNTDQAASEVQTLLADYPEERHALMLHAVLLREQAKYAAAEDVYQALLARYPDWPQVLVNYAILLDVYLGRSGQALEIYRKYLSYRPDDKEVAGWVAELERRVSSGQSE